MSRFAWFSLVMLGLSVLGMSTLPAAEPGRLPEGYLDYPALTSRLPELDSADSVRLESLGTTVERRAIHLLTIGLDDDVTRPALLVVGCVDNTRLLGTELAVRIAESLAKDAELLSRVKFYVIPQPNPDGAERAYASLRHERPGNGVRTDDDRDGEFAEDPAEDLNQDGIISSMRVYRSGGAFRADEKDPRINVLAKPSELLLGEFDLYTEGIDNDQDDAWNEDHGDGVQFNRNFAFKYPAFSKGAGAHAVSEVESRAVADFAFDHPEIALVFCFGPQDNLSTPWTHNPQGNTGRVPTSISEEDGPYFAYIAKQFGEKVALAPSPAPAELDGSFLAWAYQHYGRWSFGTPGWVILESEKPPEKPDAANGADPSKVPDKPSAPATDVPPHGGFPRGPGPGRGFRFFGRFPGGPDRRGNRSETTPQEDAAGDRRALAWMEQIKINGFVPWTSMVHPDFPDQKVEIGGFMPWWRHHPPLDEVDELAKKHINFLNELCGLLPVLRVDPIKLESLGKGLYRVSSRVANTGYLATSTHRGADGELTYPVQIELELPEQVALLTQPRRRRERLIEGGGRAVKHSWLVRQSSKDDAELTVAAFAPGVGRATATVTVPGNQ